MRRVTIICVFVLVLSSSLAEQRAEVQESKVTKVVDFGEAEIKPSPGRVDVQRKRDSGYSYNKPSRVSSHPRLRFQANQLGDEIASRSPGQLSRPFARYGPPSHSAHRGEQQRNKVQHHVSQQQSISYDVGRTQQEVPSLIRNVDFADANPIAGQNNEPFGMHTANYLPPRNQKLPAYSSADSFASTYSPSSPGQVQSSQNLAHSPNHQISDAALFLSENARAIQRLYGAPASNQDFAPSYEQIQRPGGQLANSESTSPNPGDLPSALPPYASGTLNPRETLEQIQSLEKDRLIVQLQQALAQAQGSPSVAEAAGRYAQNQASFLPSEELLASVKQQMKSHAPTTARTVAFAGGSTAFSQFPLLPGTTIDPLGLPLSYGVPTTAQTPTTTTAGAPSAADAATQVASALPAPDQPGSPVGIPVYGGFLPAFIAGSSFLPSYGTNVFTPGPVRQPSGSAPTHFGIPIPTESPQKPSSAPSTTKPVSSPNRPGVAITPVVLPVQPVRPVATPVHPVQANPPVASSSVQHSYLQTALVNPVLYKPAKAVYPVYYYSNVAYQLQKPGAPSHPWGYAPSYAQAKPAQIWK
ncbi:PREDICTED: endochitinase A-like [Dinoponera quadriceps]|uniref:Endochitinase A-like n=1 Tax=Dinoponera quadriceps TaxID=609295 RepID=A0A6P3WP79_DINQU|nr:PREDICTED: endochitinase A-like [Dinoponera quadriceps]